MSRTSKQPPFPKIPPRLAKRFVVPAIYAGITLVFALPLLVAAGTQLIGGKASDACTHVWVLRAGWEALVYQGKLIGTHTSTINYPLGGDVISCHPLNDLLSLPLQFLFGTLMAFNLIMLFHVVLAAWGAYALARYLTGDTRAAFVAGVVFGFCPFLATHAVASGGTEMVSVGWLPLAVLFGLRTLRSPGWRYPILLALMMVAIDMTCVYYVALIVLFFVGLMVYYLVRGVDGIDGLRCGTSPGTAIAESRFKGVARMAGAAALTLLLAGPHLVLLQRSIDSENSLLFGRGGERPTIFGPGEAIPSAEERPKPTEEREFQPTDILPAPQKADQLAQGFEGYSTVFLLNVIRPGGGSLQRHNNICEFQLDPYMGLAALALALLAVWRGRRQATVFWALVWVLFLAIAIGPQTSITESWQLGRLLAPARLLATVFVLHPPGHDAVYYVMSMLALAILVAMGTKVLLDRFPLRRLTVVLVIAAALLADYALLSSRPFPFKHDRVELPEAYHDKVRLAASTPILELPVWRQGTMMATREHFCYQALHHQPIADNITAVIPYSLEKNFLTLKLIAAELTTPDEAWPEGHYREGLRRLRYEGFVYVIVDSNAYSEQGWERVEPMLFQYFGEPHEYGDGYQVYTISDL